MKKPKLLVICGPTATGKSNLAVTIAKKVGGEIISADSRQIYRGLNLLSGKITKKEMRGIPHHGLDIANPKKTFSVHDYQLYANKITAEIIDKRKVPIIVGGTGFYIDAVVFGNTFPAVAPNPLLRRKLSQYRAEKLFAMLQKLDLRRSKTIDRHNKVRLIRAIEIAKALGKVPKLSAGNSQYDILYIGLDLKDIELRERIHTRLLERTREGMFREAKKLHQSGLSWKRMIELGLECKYAALYFKGKMTKEECTRKLETEIWQYAKRQRTWFKRNKKIFWFDPNKEEKTISNLVKDFLAS